MYVFFLIKYIYISHFINDVYIKVLLYIRFLIFYAVTILLKKNHFNFLHFLVSKSYIRALLKTGLKNMIDLFETCN